jgi:hypothetical protein
MGTLGQYLSSAREARSIDIRDAAQQTRISINYLKALEEEDFSKLPGEVFVRGFLKNYVRFLHLDEAEALKRYAELKPKAHPAPPPSPEMENTAPPPDSGARRKMPVEPFIWGALICTALLLFLFASLPSKRVKKGHHPENIQQLPLSTVPTDTLLLPERTGKLYLEVIALEDTWLLVRTDTSPQKKAVLKKGESLIWSADERFLLSYGRVDALKLLLNGEELSVRGAKDTPVRDLAVSRAGILNQPLPAKQPQPPARPKPKPPVQAQQAEQHPVANSPATPQVPVPAAPAQSPAAAPAQSPASAPVPINPLAPQGQ